MKAFIYCDAGVGWVWYKTIYNIVAVQVTLDETILTVENGQHYYYPNLTHQIEIEMESSAS